MNGIPIRILRDGEETRVYLSTRRDGEVGAKIKKLRRHYKKLTLERAKLYKKVAACATEAEKLALSEANTTDQIAAVDKRQDELLDKANELWQEMDEVALECVTTGLRENHAGDTTGILNCMSDQQVRLCMQAYEIGDEPEDFFPKTVTLQSETGIPSSGATT